MEYLKNSISLTDKFNKRYFDCNELFIYINKASKILRDIHNNGIVLQDLSFENILVNNNGDVSFCDIDSCSYNGNSSLFFSILFKEFVIDWRKSNLYKHEDVDKLSMILSFYYILYMQVLQKISKKQYHMLSDNINTLENLRPIANMLVNKKIDIYDLPYLDEYIDLNDHYLIDREKILSLNQKIYRIFK